MTIKDINGVFNEQIARLNKENADSFIFDLGMPSKNVRYAGVANMPLKLYGNKLMKKVLKHGYSPDELKDLPKAVSAPIAVFKNKEQEGNYSILTELSTNEGNFLVTVDVGTGNDVDFNIVSTVFGKGKERIVDWINKGYLRFVDKKKAQNYLQLAAPIAAPSNNIALISAAKIVQNFKNPNTTAQKIAFT